jgi:arginase family enzyme
LNQPTYDDGNPPKLFEDQNWPRASDWIAGRYNSEASDRVTCLGVVGVPISSSITPGKAHLAADAVRKVLEKYSVFDLPHNNDLRKVYVEDIGNLDIEGRIPEDIVQPVTDAIHKFRKENATVILLGGDNSITRPGVIGLPVPLHRCGVLTFDAHFDLRDTTRGLNNGNPIRALLADGVLGRHIVQVGIQSFANSAEYAQVARDEGINYMGVEQVYEDGIERTMRSAFEVLRDLDAIYVSLDIDVLDRSYAPAAPGSRPGGLQPWQLRQMAYMCGSHFNVAAIDFVEIDPEKDVADITCMSAAACMLSFASGLLERRERK